MQTITTIPQHTETSARKTTVSLTLSALRCFNVAAICALGIWHAYAFYLSQSLRHSPPSPVIEFQLIKQVNHAATGNKPDASMKPATTSLRGEFI
ncbi:hypothetical protein [Undibacterium sp. RuTC16W]|uniref:hypothetical protein n=1 Tax=Undibacterium sp. RuTC16W TaxID=3413048 RepID=UPI003BF43286